MESDGGAETDKIISKLDFMFYLPWHASVFFSKLIFLIFSDEFLEHGVDLFQERIQMDQTFGFQRHRRCSRLFLSLV